LDYALAKFAQRETPARAAVVALVAAADFADGMIGRDSYLAALRTVAKAL
jgi:hypothetical protein